MFKKRNDRDRQSLARRSWDTALLLVGATSVACAAPDGPQAAEVFGTEITRVVLEVDYAEGAEPYTEGLATGDVWALFEDNARALLGEEKSLTVPHALDQMQALPRLEGASFDASAILALANQYRDQQSNAQTTAYYALWLDGLYEEDGVAREEVLGVSLGTSGVIAMFKPTIEGTSLAGAGVVSRYVEQATIVHEFGHAVGLVNNGLQITSAHHDQEHGAHCINESCVMYYTVEGSSGVAQFVQQFIGTENTVLFGDECLADARAAR